MPMVEHGRAEHRVKCDTLVRGLDSHRKVLSTHNRTSALHLQRSPLLKGSSRAVVEGACRGPDTEGFLSMMDVMNERFEGSKSDSTRCLSLSPLYPTLFGISRDHDDVTS